MSENTDPSEVNRKLTELYADYLEHCQQIGIKPATREMFARQIQEVLASLAAQELAKKEMDKDDGRPAVYVATRVIDLPDPIGDPSMASCSHCDESVWVDKKMAKYREMAERIVCTKCLPEVTGENAQDIIDRMLG